MSPSVPEGPSSRRRPADRRVADVLQEPLAWLEAHVNRERDPSRPKTLATMRELLDLLGNPQDAAPVIHVTGTNGKGTTVRIASALLAARGLSVGTYTSPDLERVNERIGRDGRAVDDETLARLLDDLRLREGLLSEVPSRFELLTAAAFAYFAEVAVDVAVVEVGVGGRLDATNVCEAEVAVVTNVELDHMELLGPTRRHIATEKAGIVWPGSTLVLGETDPELEPIFEAREPARIDRRDREFGVSASRPAVGGRLVDFFTRYGRHEEVFLPLHGAHQAANAACALAAVEGLFDASLPRPLLEAGLAAVRSPGRLEILERGPLVLVDGAHNPAGMAALRRAIDEEFADRRPWYLVVGCLGGRDRAALLAHWKGLEVARVVVCEPDSPRRVPADVLAEDVRALGYPADVVPDVPDAVAYARELAGNDGSTEAAVLVTGSLYVVGEARHALRSQASGEAAGP